MKKIIPLIIVILLLVSCQKTLSTNELETKLEDMAYKAFSSSEYKDVMAGSYVIKLGDLLKFTEEEDVFINPKTKEYCDKTASMALLDVKEEKGVLKRTVSIILVCN